MSTDALAASRMTLAQYFDSIYRPRRLPGRDDKHATVGIYRNLFRVLTRYLEREPLVSDLGEDTIAAYLDWFWRLGRSTQTVNQHRSRLMALGRYATLRGLLSVAPEIAKYPEFDELPDYYTPEQVGSLLGACAGCHGAICGIPARVYFRALLLLVYDTGVRKNTAWRVLRDDVDLDSRIVYFRAARASKVKTGQLLRIADDTAEAIRVIWLPGREELFPWPAGEPAKHHRIDKIVRRAGLPTGRSTQLQKLRRTNGTLAKMYGGDATRQLGHSGEAVTRRHYLAPCSFVQAADVIPRPICK